MAFKTRFAPSPTGNIHLGNTRTALFCYLSALKATGTFMLRIEDTDRERSRPEYEESLQQDLLWLGLTWNEGPNHDQGNGPYYQAARQPLYDAYYQKLEANGHAYPCFCQEAELTIMRKLQRARGEPPRYPGTCRHLTADQIAAKCAAGLTPTLRFHVPDDITVSFTDLVHGEQHIAGREMGDFIIRRTDGTPPFLFCNAIDDALMGVTLVLRGEDHLSNTPRQLLILDALQLPRPDYAHIALIVGFDGAPLSKRNGSQSIHTLRETGYLPIAINNYLARLGHSFEGEQLLSLPQLAQHFDLHRLSKSPARFDEQQLQHWQQEAVLRLSEPEWWAWVGTHVYNQVPADKHKAFFETLHPNIRFPHTILPWLDICFSKQWRAPTLTAPAGYFDCVCEIYKTNGPELPTLIQALKTTLGIQGKSLYEPLRMALTGQPHGPELGKLLQLMEPTLIAHRLTHARTLTT